MKHPVVICISSRSEKRVCVCVGGAAESSVRLMAECLADEAETRALITASYCPSPPMISRHRHITVSSSACMSPSLCFFHSGCGLQTAHTLPSPALVCNLLWVSATDHTPRAIRQWHFASCPHQFDFWGSDTESVHFGKRERERLVAHQLLAP